MFLAVQDNSINDLVTCLQSTAELSQTHGSFLTIDQKDEEAWYDQQGDKDKNVHTKTETKTLKIVNEKNLSTVLKMTLWK